jgi:hypothetical protein
MNKKCRVPIPSTLTLFLGLRYKRKTHNEELHSVYLTQSVIQSKNTWYVG